MQPGTIIGNDTLVELLNATPPAEFFDVSESSYNYVQRIPFEKYNSDTQLFTSEWEFILGSLLSHTPETVFKLATWNDLLDLKQKGPHFKTKLQKITYLNKCLQALIKL